MPDPSEPPAAPDALVLAADVETELVERRSRFLARLHRVSGTEEAEARLRTARAEHPSARHHCSALVLSPTATDPVVHRSSDDGEPAGTAGQPMLQALLHAGLTDAFAVVVRYFGGVKLGAGGLVRAYTASIEQAVAAADLRRRTLVDDVVLTVPPAEVGLAEHAVRTWAAAHGGTALPTEHGSREARLRILLLPELREAFAADVARWSSGRLHPEQVGRRAVDLPLDRR